MLARAIQVPAFGLQLAQRGQAVGYAGAVADLPAEVQRLPMWSRA